jgi:hypothetical protein
MIGGTTVAGDHASVGIVRFVGFVTGREEGNLEAIGFDLGEIFEVEVLVEDEPHKLGVREEAEFAQVLVSEGRLGEGADVDEAEGSGGTGGIAFESEISAATDDVGEDILGDGPRDGLTQQIGGDPPHD